MASLAARLVSCPSQRVLSRACYAEEYEESLRQCMKGKPTALAVQHQVLRRVTTRAVFIRVLIVCSRVNIFDLVSTGAEGGEEMVQSHKAHLNQVWEEDWNPVLSAASAFPLSGLDQSKLCVGRENASRIS